MNKNEKTNKYVEAANVANKFLDAMFGALNLKDSEKYHITEDDLKDVVNDVKDKATTAKDNVKKLSNNLMVDFSDLANTINQIVDDYKDKYLSNSDDNCDHDNCDHDDCECDELYDGPCGCDECCNAYTNFEDDEEYPEFTPEYCASIKDRLMQEFDDERMCEMLVEDDEYYSYDQVLNDINCILDDVENNDYELIPANEQCKHDTVHVTYHLGYDTEDEYEIAFGYASRLADDLRELYGFSEVHVNVETSTDQEYLTYNIYMMI